MEHLTYLALLFGWALPVIGLHWLVGAPELRARRRLLAVAVLVPTAYLSAADALAIGSGIWSISEELTVGLRVGGLVFEEVIFFFLTNVMVAQSVILFLSPTARARAWRLVRRQPKTSAADPALTPGPSPSIGRGVPSVTRIGGSDFAPHDGEAAQPRS